MKIFIPEIPKEWTQRTRSGHTNIWNDEFYRNGLPEVKLEPPMRGLYAKRFDDGWYWVCGCHHCLENDKPYSYITCDEHDRCMTCGTPRKELAEIPWGKPYGIQCKPCYAKEHEERKQEALRLAKERGHSEDDCYYISKVLCPVCGTEQSSDDLSDEDELTCSVCDTEFIVQVNYEVRYSSFIKKGEE